MKSTYCLGCKHFRGLNLCHAYPKGIPVEILSGKEPHNKPRKDDKGYQYERSKLGELLERE